MSRLVIHDLIESVWPKKNKRLAARSAAFGAQVAQNAMMLVVAKQPALAPLQGILGALLAESDNDDDFSMKLLAKAKKLEKLFQVEMNPKEKKRLKQQVQALKDLLVEAA